MVWMQLYGCNDMGEVVWVQWYVCSGMDTMDFVIMWSLQCVPWDSIMGASNGVQLFWMGALLWWLHWCGAAGAMVEVCPGVRSLHTSSAAVAVVVWGALQEPGYHATLDRRSQPRRCYMRNLLRTREIRDLFIKILLNLTNNISLLVTIN